VGIYNVLAVRGRWCQRLHRGHERRSGEPRKVLAGSGLQAAFQATEISW